MPTGDPLPAHSFGSITVRLVNDDIAARRVEAVVTEADDRLPTGGDTVAALLSRGGIGIHKEDVAEAQAQLGSVVRTATGKLARRYVYHAVVIDHDAGKTTSLAHVVEAVRGALACTLTDGVRTVAMPLLGAGTRGLGVHQALEAILEAIEDVSTNYPWTVEVEIVVRDIEEFVEAAKLFRDYGGHAAREAEDAEVAAQFLKLLLRKQ
jgi:O-acetyl-ADP-ribose deacetylase (regulator of RNase III)